jgi:starch synthase
MDASQNPRKANGIKFTDYSVRALSKAIRKALVVFKEPEILKLYRRNAMAADFSWERTVKEYEKVYRML